MVLTRAGFLRAAWKLAWPYWRSDEKWSATGPLVSVVALNLVAVWINVRLNLWNKDFYDALQEYDWPQFWCQFALFSVIAAGWIAVAVYQLYLRQILHIRWRRWLTEQSLKGWLDHQAYYRIQIDQSTTDNPDQRIADDLDSFATLSLSLSMGMLNSLVTLYLVSVHPVAPLGSARRSRSGAIDSLYIPGYLVFAALIYAVAGTWLTHWIGRPLAGLMFNQQRFEADFRFSLVRLREHAESVAFYRGEAHEYGRLRRPLRPHHRQLVGHHPPPQETDLVHLRLCQLAMIFPFLVAAPHYFAKRIQLGGLMQMVSRLRPGAGFAVLYHQQLHLDRRVPGGGRAAGRLPADGGGDRQIAGAAQPIAIERGGDGVEVGALDLDLPDGAALQRDLAMAAGRRARC